MGVQVARVYEPGSKRGRFLWIPAPVAAPGDISPGRAEYQDQRHAGKTEHDRTVARCIDIVAAR